MQSFKNYYLVGTVPLIVLLCESVDPELKGGNLGSWMATKDPSLNAAENVFLIEI